MATIKSSLSMYDGMTAPLQRIHRALNIVLNSFEAVQDASGNVIDVSAIQDARDELARAEIQLDQMEQNIRDAEEAQDQFNGSVREGANAADALGGKLKGILATVVSIAGMKSALNWVGENLKLSDTQRNAENQLKAVLANMGVEDIEIPVTANTEAAVHPLEACADAMNTVDGTTVNTFLWMDTGDTPAKMDAFEDWRNRTDGGIIESSMMLNGPDHPSALFAGRETPLTLPLTVNTADGWDTYNSFVNAADGNTITANMVLDTTQTMSAFDAIANKASEIQSRGVYGDEIMLAGAAEFATYFSDAEAIMSMMDTLTNYAMGMSATEGRGLSLDSAAMVDYATNIGKIMTGAYDAMTKKGFTFTDAQKAIIEGTATHAQYVEALGEDYASMSEDMRAATVINSIIAESWDGLYEAMSNTPEGKIIQFNNTLGDLREVLGDRVYPAVLHFFDVFTERFPQIEQLLTGFSDACSVLIIVLTWIAEAALNVASVFADNWGWIGPVIYGIAGALAVYYGWQLAVNAVEAVSRTIKIASAAAAYIHAAATGAEVSATAAATAAQYGLNTALYACPIMWIIMLVVALIAVFYAAVAAVNKFAGTSYSATGIICGIFAAAGAFIGNLLVVLWNTVVDIFVRIYNFVGGIAAAIGNVFNDPVGSIVQLFYTLADTVLGVLETIASAIDTIFGFNLAGAVQGWRSSLKGWTEDTFGVEVWEGIDGEALKMDRFEYKAAFNSGKEFGKGLEDKVSGLFKMPTLDEMGFDNNDVFNLGNNLDGIYGNTGDTAANTAAAADKLDYMDEDLAWMKDIAEREAINRYTTAEITVEQHNENHISKDTDIDGIMDAWAFDFAERLDIEAEGVHE